MSEEHQLQAAGELQLDDLLRFQYFHLLGRNWLIAFAVLAAFCLSLLGIIVCLASGDPRKIQNPGLQWLFLLGFGVLLLGQLHWSARRQFAKQRYLREPMRYLTSEERVGLQSPSYSSEVDWAMIQAIYETKSLFLIYTAPQVAWVLPKRFFWGDEQRALAWKQFAMRKLAGRFHQPGTVAAWL